MGVREFRGDEERLESQIEEMAHIVYGLPKDEKSKASAEEMAALLLALSRVKVEKEEEPFAPMPPHEAGEGGQNG